MVKQDSRVVLFLRPSVLNGYRHLDIHSASTDARLVPMRTMKLTIIISPTIVSVAACVEKNKLKRHLTLVALSVTVLLHITCFW